MKDFDKDFRTRRTITVDDREMRSGIVDLLQKGGWQVKVQRLVCGDFRIGQDVLIEKKTARDFAVSIIDWRLFRQVAQLKKQGLRTVVVIEGDPFSKRYAIESEAVRGAIVSVSLIWQVPVILSESLEQTVRILGYMAEQTHRLEDLPLHRPGYRPKRMMSRKLFILQGLPGIGAQRAARLLTRFGSLRRVFNAPWQQWTEVEGVGKQGAQRISHLLDDPWV